MAGKGASRFKTLTIPVYLAVALVVFSATLWKTLPYGDFAKVLERELSKREVFVEIGAIEPVTPLAYRLEGLKVLSVGGQPLGLSLGDALVSADLTSLIGGAPELEASFRPFGGIVKARGTLSQGDAPTISGSLSWRELDMSFAQALLKGAELELAGACDGTLDFTLTGEKLEQAKAKIAASVTGLKVGPGSVQGFTIPELDLGGGTVNAELDKGRLKIEKLELAGGDMKLSLGGSVSISKPITRSALDLSLALSPKPKMLEELGLVFGMMAGYKKQDGTYSVRLKGSIAAPYLQKR